MGNPMVSLGDYRCHLVFGVSLSNWQVSVRNWQVMLCDFLSILVKKELLDPGPSGVLKFVYFRAALRVTLPL